MGEKIIEVDDGVGEPVGLLLERQSDVQADRLAFPSVRSEVRGFHDARAAAREAREHRGRKQKTGRAPSWRPSLAGAPVRRLRRPATHGLPPPGRWTTRLPTGGVVCVGDLAH